MRNPVKTVFIARTATALVLSALLITSGCSSLFKKKGADNPSPAASASPSPANASVEAFKARMPHPDGFEISDVRAIFNKPGAPSLGSLGNCDFDYQAETNLARNREELFMTLPEHVKSDPEKYHWCFYAKILKLDDELSKDLYVDEKQKILIKRYPFFVHIARIFLVDFDDPRYLEFATHNYKRLKKLYFNS